MKIRITLTYRKVLNGGSFSNIVIDLGFAFQIGLLLTRRGRNLWLERSALHIRVNLRQLNLFHEVTHSYFFILVGWRLLLDLFFLFLQHILINLHDWIEDFLLQLCLLL